MRKVHFFILAILVLSGCSSAQDDGWTRLFNGKDLTGWEQKNGEAKFEVKDGMIVGTTVLNTPNSFLCTEKVYGDFIFEVELLVEENMNSGIQFRSESKPDYRDGRVHGYQCEVDPSDRAWSGGIYDEARRGWLYPLTLNPDARSALEVGEWNHYRIECIGNSLRTWVNGVPAAHLIDDMTPEGFIALQVHGIGNNQEAEGHQIKWKNIRIKTEDLKPAPDEGIHVENLIPNHLSDAEKAQGFELLFDGKSTENLKSAGGEEFPSQGWTVENGVLAVQGGAGGGDIITRETYGPFELKFEFSLSKGANSGVKYCIGNNGPSIGLEYQILDNENFPGIEAGGTDSQSMASLYDLIPAGKEARYDLGSGQWNRGRIVLYPGGKAQHWLNGRKVVQYTHGSPYFEQLVENSKYAKYEGFAMAGKGPVLLQDHGCHEENGCMVKFRSLKIRAFQQ